MPSLNGAGESQFTEIKQCHFRKFLVMHMKICKGLYSRQKSNPPYFFFDLHAGPGITSGQPGSPLIFADLAFKYEFLCHSFHFEQMRRNFNELAERMKAPCPNCPKRMDAHEVFYGSHEQAIQPILERYRNDKSSYRGVIYADPNGAGIPVDTINAILDVPCFSGLDVLVFINATSIKRAMNAYPHLDKPRLRGVLADIHKRETIIRQPVGCWQMSLALLTNWPAFPEMEADGFANCRTKRGNEILCYLDMTAEELAGLASRKTWRPLPFQPGLGF